MIKYVHERSSDFCNRVVINDNCSIYHQQQSLNNNLMTETDLGVRSQWRMQINNNNNSKIKIEITQSAGIKL